MMFAIFYSPQGILTSVPSKQEKTVTGHYYKSKVLSKVVKYYKKRRPASGIRHICLLHDNALPHRAHVVTKFLDEQKVKVMIRYYVIHPLNILNINFKVEVAW